MAAPDPPPALPPDPLGASVYESEFSIVRGGPTFLVLLRARLSDNALRLAHRRLILVVLLTWAPALVLAALAGDAFGHPRSFLADIGFHVRFLLVVPTLVLSEVLVHRRLKPIIQQFHVRGLVRPDDVPRLERAFERAWRWRNAMTPEIIMAAVVLTLAVAFNHHRYQTLIAADTWYATSAGIKPAGVWLVFVSLPLLQFLLLRWYYRLLIWGVLITRISRLDLDLEVTHPDKLGGLGFLSDTLLAFMPLAFAHGALLAGTMANRIFYAGATLDQFKFEVLGAGLILLVIFVGPLFVFMPVLLRVKRDGLLAYGVLGQAHSRQFRDKWLRGGADPDELLIGNPDISSLADMGGSISAAQDMRLVPIRIGVIAAFSVAFLAPMLPLVLTAMSPEALLDRIVSMVF